MSIRLPLGWDVSMAVTARRSGRLAVTGSGSSGWGWDVRYGYPCWGYTQNTVTEHEKISRTLLQWLCRKSIGMNILMFYPASDSNAFGPIGFKDFVTRSGSATVDFPQGGTWSGGVGMSSTITVTNQSYANNTWTLNAWYGSGGGVWDPTDYDLVIMPNGGGTVSYHWAGIDAYLAQGGSIWSLIGSGWERYGFTNVGNQSGGVAPDYLCPAFAAAPIGSETYRYGIYSTNWITTTTNTIGGESYAYPTGGATERLGLWDAISLG